MNKIIAETAFSHEGNFEYLVDQINKAHLANVDFIKFQVFLNAEEYMVTNHPSIDLVKKWMFTEEQWENAFKIAKEKKLRILALPLNETSAKFCYKNDDYIDLYEIHSVCFKDDDIINVLKRTNKKIVFGVGGRKINEIKRLIKLLNKSEDQIILMFGFQSFPTDSNKLNMGKMRNLFQEFSCDLGYADHSSYEDTEFHNLNAYAFFLGARYFEKHIVLNKGEKRIDFETGIETGDFIEMKNKLKELQNIFGNSNIDDLNDKELNYRKREKVAVYSKDIQKGSILTDNCIVFKITPNTIEEPDYFKEDVVGSILLENVKKNQIVNLNHF